MGFNQKEVGRLFFVAFVILGFLLLGYLIRPILPALSISLVLTYLLLPVVRLLQPILRWRWLAVLVTFLFIIIPFFIFIGILANTLVSQLIELSKTPQMKDMLDLLGANFNRYLAQSPSEIFPGVNVSTFTSFRGVLTQGFETLLGILKALGGLFLQVLLGIFLTVYLLLKRDSVVALFDNLKDQRLRRFIFFVDEALKQVVYSMFFTALITGVIAVIIYMLLGVPFAVLWGVTTGIVALIPVLGTWLVYMPITIYFLIQGKVFLALVFLGVSIVFLSTLPDVAVRPLIASKKIDVVLIILGLVTGTIAFGPVGVIIGPLVIISWVGFVKIFLLEEET
jgi:predicted PurR-regulated permease PerM